MTGALYYPPADRSQWYGPGNATVAPTKVLWHSTETAGGWPDYAGGSMAPTLTYEPWLHRWRQHFPLNGTARALRNGPGYSTNREGVAQVEVSCYCDPARMGAYHVSRLDQQAYDDMGHFGEFMHAEWGVPAESPVQWLPYPRSYGANGVRLSGAGFRAARGHVAHMHAPYNDHGDAGALDIGRILAAAGNTTAQPQEDDMGYLIRAATGAVVFIGAQGPRLVKTPSDLGVLEQLGYTYGPRGAAPALFRAMDEGPFGLLIEQNGGLPE